MAVGDRPKIVLNYETILEVNTTPDETDPTQATWARICKGFDSMAESLNEVLYQASFFCDNGWGSTEVTGGQWTLDLTGVRYLNDPAQEYFFSIDVEYAWGIARNTQLRLTRADGYIFLWDVTIATIAESDGNSNDPKAFSIAIHGNGAPQITAPGVGP